MVITGRRPIAGLTNNSESSLLDILFKWYALDGSTFVTLTGTIVSQSGSYQHSADLRVIKDNNGNEVTCLYANEKVTIDVVAVPLGAAGASQEDEARSAAQFPKPGAFVQISQAPVIVCGNFSDVLNSSDWMYNADGRIEMASEGEWGMRFSLTRRIGMTKSAAVTL